MIKENFVDKTIMAKNVVEAIKADMKKRGFDFMGEEFLYREIFTVEEGKNVIVQDILEIKKKYQEKAGGKEIVWEINPRNKDSILIFIKEK